VGVGNKKPPGSGPGASISRSMQYFYQSCFPKNESGKSGIPSLLISQDGYFTSRRCCCGLLEPLGSFGRTVAFAFDAFFSVMRIFGLFDFLNHLPILLTLNPSMSITFFMKRGLFKW